LEAHPPIITPYTSNPATANINRMPTFKSVNTQPLLNGITDHATKDKTKVTSGAKIKTTLSEPAGMTISLKTYFRKSANDCKSPKTPTTFGPFRICTAAQIFLSAYMRNARQISTDPVIKRH
jgi:hypothetical protein